MDIETPAQHPLFAAHKAAWNSSGKEKTAAAVIKHGGHGGPGGIRHVPAKNIAACLKDLEALAGGKPSTSRTAAGFEAIRAAAYGGDKPKPAPVPSSFEALAASAYEKWNSAKPKPKPAEEA